MSVAEQAGSTGSGAVAARPPASRFQRGTVLHAAGIAIFVLLLFFVLPGLTSNYWLQICTQVVVYSVVALGLALLVGRVGMVSLGQIALLALGGWVALRIGFATGLPFPILMLVAGLMTMFDRSRNHLTTIRLEQAWCDRAIDPAVFDPSFRRHTCEYLASL